MLAYKAEEHQCKSFFLLIVLCIKIIVSLVVTIKQNNNIMKKTTRKQEALYFSVLGVAVFVFTAAVLLSAHGLALLLGTTL